MAGQACQDPAFDLVHLPQTEACGQLVSGLPRGRTPASRSLVPIPNDGFCVLTQSKLVVDQQVAPHGFYHPWG